MFYSNISQYCVFIRFYTILWFHQEDYLQAPQLLGEKQNKQTNKHWHILETQWRAYDTHKGETGDASPGSEPLIKSSFQLASVTLQKVTEGYLVAVMMQTSLQSVQQRGVSTVLGGRWTLSQV